MLCKLEGAESGGGEGRGGGKRKGNVLYKQGFVWIPLLLCTLQAVTSD